jgi:hypothetical protein
VKGKQLNGTLYKLRGGAQEFKMMGEHRWRRLKTTKGKVTCRSFTLKVITERLLSMLIQSIYIK